jgi:hypothetical protein
MMSVRMISKPIGIFAMGGSEHVLMADVNDNNLSGPMTSG